MLRCFTVALAGLLCACDYNDADEGSSLPVTPYASVAPVAQPTETSTATSPPKPKPKPMASEEELVDQPPGHGSASDAGTELADAAPSAGQAADGSVAEDAGSNPSHSGRDSSDSPSSDSPSSDSSDTDVEASETATAGEETESEPAESDVVGVSAEGELDAGTSLESPDDGPGVSLDASAELIADSGPSSDSGSVSPEASAVGADAAP
jgi:hypothetical protein